MKLPEFTEAFYISMYFAPLGVEEHTRRGVYKTRGVTV
jgi:hypothetical protein